MGVRGCPINAAARSRDSDALPWGVTLSEYGVAQRMPAQSAVAPAAAIFNIVLSLVCHPGAHTTKTISTHTGGRFDSDQILPPQLVHAAFICNADCPPSPRNLVGAAVVTGMVFC